MRPQKVDDSNLLKGLMSVLRSKGYDGASLNELALSSGLQKASLYHRFPGGKKEIGLAVLGFVNQWTYHNIVCVLTKSEKAPKDKLIEALKNINDLYESGECTCIIRALSMDEGLIIFGTELKKVLEAWHFSFEQFGIDIGLDKDQAKKTAYNVLIKIQGSLIISKTLNDYGIFKQAIRDIEESYIMK